MASQLDRYNCELCDPLEEDGFSRSVVKIPIADLPEAMSDGWAPWTIRGFSKVWREEDTTIWVYRANQTAH